MLRASWLCWFIVLFAVYAAEAQYKFRRPMPVPPPLPPQIFKKSWAPGPRIPPMGNPMHIGPTGYPHKRPLFKPPNYRFRRPPGPPPPPPPPPSSLYNVVPNSYKNPLPPGLSTLNNNYNSLSQRMPPVKELQSIAKVPQQYSPEYRPEITLPTHRGGLDDDKGPIHTIPAPNLGPASKSYQQQQQHQQQQQQQQLASSNKQDDNSPRRPYTVTQVDYATVFNGQDSNVTPQRAFPSSPTPVSSITHQYEVTESNEVQSGPSNYFTPDFDTAHFSTSIIHDQQANDVYLNHPSSVSRNGQTQQQQLEGPSIQANLHSSMHVGSSSTPFAQQQSQQASDLHVGQPAAAGPPMSAAKLYEVLNAFPQQLTDQYALNQQPQIQQHLLQQQLSQILQQQDEQNAAAIKASFAQPTLHSFNYDEQANKQKHQQQQQQQQQQNVYIDQNYGSGRVTADYSLAPETSAIAQEVNVADNSEHQENNIEFENAVGHVRPATYFTKIGDDQGVTSQFYTTLPNREAAEKLAALAAAGNVNSQLIGQLRKQQQQQDSQEPQSDQPMPANHKEEHRAESENMEKHNERQRQQQIEHRQKLFYRRQNKIKDEILKREDEKLKLQNKQEEDKRPLRIFVPEDNEDKEKEVNSEDYEYENDESEVPRENESISESSDFGSRIVSKSRK